MTKETWLAIAIGNTHIRAAIFSGTEISVEYVKPHIELDELEYELDRYSYDRILIASVVPDVVTPWHGLAHTQIVSSQLVPIGGIYKTFGVDRALVALGAGVTYGYPVLAIDAGTSLTLTGIDATPALVGGAILPGLHAQFKCLRLNAALLPLANPPSELPTLWANDTIASMQSGVVNTVVAGLKRFIIDWQKQFPRTPVIITGGEGEYIQSYLQGGKLDKRLIFWGMRSL
ncbi:type III pantothenate kinase [Pseudanabaena sp. PCC 6802]|uniref:type III pantothenate kinase n=1 Tax=Pseudanabaena sp. PCC 6802 TaxID=118173 RepID=UPI00034676CB|nr:type III pantothenate kinase [Pseudanabaena sp. PCC 6802]